MLGNGRVVKVDEGIDPAALARLVNRGRHAGSQLDGASDGPKTPATRHA
jgi:hypothetical protein